MTDMGPEIWVYGDLRSERLFERCLKVLARARDLAASVSGRAMMVLAGSSAAPDRHGALALPAAAEGAIAAGADQAIILDHPKLGVPRADLYSVALCDLIRSRSPMLMLFPLSDFSRELAARTARLLNAGLIADCADLRIDQGRVVATSPAFGGEIMAEIAFAHDRGTGLATVQTHGLSVGRVRGQPGTIERIRVDDLKAPSGLSLVSRSPEPEEHRRLEDAETVVAGGAGLGSADGFSLVRELAAALGGEVGATRPAVLQHWADEERLIGQTGKTVRPALLFSVGTSGAIQYTAGITEAGTIVAVNRDPEAPIFRAADIGVVADAGTFLPMLVARVRRAVMRKLADFLGEEGEKPGSPGAGEPAGFGDKVKKLREAHAWSREELAQATGQSPEFIEKVETEEVTPPVSFLLGLARALGVDPSAFLTDQEKSVIRDERTKAFVKRTENYSYQTLTPGAENEHLRAFMITIEPKQAHKPVAYKHEGEEFVFVMEGELELTLGQKSRHLRPGESIHFNSDIPHKLRSLSEEPTRCLVVLFTP